MKTKSRLINCSTKSYLPPCAIFWDIENLSPKEPLNFIDGVFKYLKSYCSISKAVIIGNIQSRIVKSLIPEISQRGFEIIQMSKSLGKPGLKLPKNSADIALVINALETLFLSPSVETFVIISNDSDFRPLIQTLFRYKKKIIVISDQTTSSVYLKLSDALMLDYRGFYKQDELNNLGRCENSKNFQEVSKQSSGTKKLRVRSMTQLEEILNFEDAVKQLNSILQKYFDEKRSIKLNAIKLELLQENDKFYEVKCDVIRALIKKAVSKNVLKVEMKNSSQLWDYFASRTEGSSPDKARNEIFKLLIDTLQVVPLLRKITDITFANVHACLRLQPEYRHQYFYFFNTIAAEAASQGIIELSYNSTNHMIMRLTNRESEL